jgi:hypothetical protein
MEYLHSRTPSTTWLDVDLVKYNIEIVLGGCGDTCLTELEIGTCATQEFSAGGYFWSAGCRRANTMKTWDGTRN